MDVVDVLAELRERGVTMRLESGKLRYRAVEGSYTQELRALVEEHRDALMEHLETSVAPAVPFQPMRCNDCGAEGMTVYLGMTDGSEVCRRCWVKRQGAANVVAAG